MKPSDQDPQFSILIRNTCLQLECCRLTDDSCGGVKHIKIFSMTRISRGCLIDGSRFCVIGFKDLASNESMHVLLSTGTWFKSSLPRICIDSSEPLLLVHTRKGC